LGDADTKDDSPADEAPEATSAVFVNPEPARANKIKKNKKGKISGVTTLDVADSPEPVDDPEISQPVESILSDTPLEVTPDAWSASKKGKKGKKRKDSAFETVSELVENVEREISQSVELEQPTEALEATDEDYRPTSKGKKKKGKKVKKAARLEDSELMIEPVPLPEAPEPEEALPADVMAMFRVAHV